MLQETRINDKTIRWIMIPAEKLEAMNPWWLETKSRASRDSTFRSYMDANEMKIPETCSWARSIIVAATEFVPRKLPFMHEGMRKSIIQPPAYYTNSVKRADVKEYLLKRLATDGVDPRLETCDSLPMKLLAASSGLGKYGRNNIVYVDGLGTAHSLAAFYSDLPFKAEYGLPGAPVFKTPFPGPERLERCGTCSLCVSACPTCSIPGEFGLINVDTCIPLWNETDREAPDTIPKKAHNALMGCILCQKDCPENKTYYEPKITLPEINEEALGFFLAGTWNETTRRILAEIVVYDEDAGLKEYLPILRRNLSNFIASGRES